MLDTYFWTILVVLWLVLWRPGMVEWWQRRHLPKKDRQDLSRVHYVEDIFNE